MAVKKKTDEASRSEAAESEGFGNIVHVLSARASWGEAAGTGQHVEAMADVLLDTPSLAYEERRDGARLASGARPSRQSRSLSKHLTKAVIGRD